MSDCFDHAGDAYNDLCFGQTNDELAEGNHNYRKSFSREYRSFYATYQSIGKTCKFCGMPYLRWREIDGHWKLCKDGKPHDCKPRIQ